MTQEKVSCSCGSKHFRILIDQEKDIYNLVKAQCVSCDADYVISIHGSAEA